VTPFPYLRRRSESSGSGVCTLHSVKRGQALLIFTGPVLATMAHRAALRESDEDWFLQISATEYLGPSGGLDDFVNHACEPNCGLQFGEAGIRLVAVTDIAAGEQLTFDYATTQNAYPKRFRCLCGSPRCRGEIGDFDDLPAALKRRYHELGILAPWLAETFVPARRRPRRQRIPLPVPA